MKEYQCEYARKICDKNLCYEIYMIIIINEQRVDANALFIDKYKSIQIRHFHSISP